MMRWIMMALLIAALAGGAAAQPAARLSDWAPPGTMLFVEFRTDDATIGGIDSLIANVTGRLGIRDVPTLAGAAQVLGLRQWLGPRAALVVLPPATLDGIAYNWALLTQIRDRAAVEAFFREAGATALPNQNGGSIFVANGMAVTVTDELVIAAAGMTGTALRLPGRPSLSDHAPFNEAMAALPGDDYAVRAYLDPQGLALALAAESPAPLDASAINLPALSQSLGILGAGLTQLDDRSYALDVAHLHGEQHIFEALYQSAPPVAEPGPVDPDWLTLLPDDVYFAVQISRPWTQFRALLETIALGGDALRTRALLNAGLFEQATGIDPVQSPLTLIPPSLSSTAVLNVIEGVLNMSDAELTAAFDGQAVLAGRARAGGALDYLLAVESSNLDAGQRIVRGVLSMLPLIGAGSAEATDEQIVFPPLGEPFESPMRLLAYDNVLYLGSDALILADKQTLVAVPRLPDAEPFTHDRAFFLPDATHLAYLHLPPLRDVVDARPPAPDMPDLYAMLDLFDSFWISGRSEPTRTVARLAFTLTP